MRMKKHAKPIALLVALIAFSIATAIFPMREWIQASTNWIVQLGPAGVIVFIGAYAIATTLLLPGWIFTVSAGLLFGVVRGTTIALTGATLGAALSFLIARYLVRARVESFAKSNPRFGAIDHAMGENGWKIVGLLRLNPLIPFNISNYFLGVTAIPFWQYVSVSAIAMLPGALLYAYLGAMGKVTLQTKSASGILQDVVFGFGLALTILITVLIGRIARRAQKRTGVDVQTPGKMIRRK